MGLLDKQTEMKMVEEYLNGASSYELARKYGFKTKKSVLDKVRKHGFEPRTSVEASEAKKTYSGFSMEHIDSNFKAYYLGLLLTDGYIIGNDTVGISLVDEDCISFLAKSINAHYSTVKREGNRQDAHRLVLKSKSLVNNLVRLGVVNNKSLTLQPPQLTEDEEVFIPYIIRGMIDGDGWIRKDGNEFFIGSMSRDFIGWTKYVLERKLFMYDINIHQGNEGIWIARSSLARNITILKALVYDRPFGMERKYNRLHNTTENLQRL